MVNHGTIDVLSLNSAFESFKKSAVRIETLPYYQVDDEIEFLTSVKNGDKPDLRFMARWHSYLDNVTASGKTSLRLRLISNPPTDYECSEIRWAYPENTKHGEEIRLINRSKVKNHPGDVWIFDNRYGFELIYNQNGVWIKEQSLSDIDLKKILNWFNKVWPIAVPDLKLYRY